MAGREPNFHKKYVVFWAKHLQMGPTKDIWGPLKVSYCLPPPKGFSSVARQQCSNVLKGLFTNFFSIVQISYFG